MNNSRVPTWVAAWQPMIEAVGRDFDADRPLVWGERIDATGIARYIEPLEMESRLHSDEGFARAQGYADIVVPCSALVTFTLPLLWRPGEAPLFVSAERDDSIRNPLKAARSALEPHTANGFAVRWDTEFLKPVILGDRLCRRGAVLVSCTPKQTKVGQGAFLQWQSEIINESREAVARIRSTVFRYNPLPAED